MSNDLKNKFIYQLIVSGTQVLVPLFTYPYITRVLGPQNIGVINYIDFLSQVFTVFAAFGIPYYAVREIAAVKNDVKKRQLLIAEMSLLNFIFSVIATAGFILFTFSSWHQYPLLYFFATVNILISAFSFEWYLQGTEAFRFAAVRTFIIRTAMIICFYLFIKQQDDYNAYFAIYAGAIFIFSLFNIIKMLGENRLHFLHLNLKQHLKPLWHFFLTSSAISIYIYFDTIILQHITHNALAVGYYSFVLKMVKIFLLVILAIGTVLSPRLSYLVSEGYTTETSSYINRLLQFIIIAAVPAGAGMMLLAPEIIVSIAGEKFLPAVPLLRILAWLPLIIGLSNVFCFQTLVPFKQEKRFLSTVITGCFVSIGLNLLLIPYLQQTGAAIASISTEIVITVMSGYLASKFIKFQPGNKMIAQTIAASLIFIPVVYLTRSLFSNPFLILTVSITACVTLYYILQIILFKNEILIQAKNYFLHLLSFNKLN